MRLQNYALVAISGFFLSALPVAAQTARPAPAPAALATGAYECWAFSSPRMGLNFTVTGPGQYVGLDNVRGTFTYNPATKEVVFRSGPLQGVMPDGFKSIYEVRQGKPTLSFIGRSGAEASFCEHV